MPDLKPGDPWTGDGYCVKCKEKREFSAVVSVVQARLMAKGYCTYCGTKLNRVLGAWLPPAPETMDEFRNRAGRAYMTDPVVHAKVKIAMNVSRLGNPDISDRELGIARDAAVYALAVTGDILNPEPVTVIGPLLDEDLRNFKPTHWAASNGMSGTFKPPDRLKVAWCYKSAQHAGHRYRYAGEDFWCDGALWPPEEHKASMTDISVAYPELRRSEVMQSGLDVDRLIQHQIAKNLADHDAEKMSQVFEPIPSIEDIAKAYDGCDDPACSLCKNL
jgi:hypothetical protein